MKKSITILLLLMIIPLLFSCSDTTVPTETQMQSTVGEEQNQKAPSDTLYITENGKSEYVIVHDGTPATKELASSIASLLQLKFATKVEVTTSKAAKNQYEIVIGNARPEADEVVKNLSPDCDFSLAVKEDTLFLNATSSSAYTYLEAVLKKDVFVRTDERKELVLSPEDSFVFSTSSYADKNLVDFFQEIGAGIKLDEICDRGSHSFESTTLPYRIYFPANYSPDKEYPLVVHLHGAGLRGNDNKRQLSGTKMFTNSSLGFDETIILYPQCPENQKWVDSNWSVGSYSLDQVGESNELACVMDLIRKIQETYSVDESRIYAMGFSMGGYGTWNLLMRHSDVFAAGIAMCGAADPSKAHLLTDLPIWAIHGAKDPTVPVAGSREMVEAIKKAGGKKIRYTELADHQHDVWTYTYASEEMLTWLLAQKKG